MKKRILYISYFEHHLLKAMPVLQAAQAYPGIEVVCACLTADATTKARTQGLSVIDIDPFAARPRQTEFDLGWVLDPMIRIIKEFNPDLVLVMEVNYSLRNIIRYCRDNRIKTMVMQHGAPNSSSLHAFAPFEGDIFAAWGDFSRDYLIKHGVPAERIVVTGSPSFIRYDNRPQDIKEVRAGLGVDDTEKIIVFTTQNTGAGGLPTAAEIRNGVQQAALALGKRSDARLFVQVTHSQPIREVQQLVDEVGAHQTIVGRYPNTQALIAASSGLITFFSTTAIEALFMEKPILLITLEGEQDFFPFVSMKAAYGAERPEEIEPAVNRLLDKPEALAEGRDLAAPPMVRSGGREAVDNIMVVIFELLKDVA